NYPSLHLFLDFNSWFWNTPRGPQMYSCITYIEKNLRVDCEFPETYNIPGPFCEYKQDGRLMGSTYPNTPVHMIPPIETRRRANVTLVPPNICRLTWMPMSDDHNKYYLIVMQCLFVFKLKVPSLLVTFSSFKICGLSQSICFQNLLALKLWLSCSIFVSLFQTGNLLVCSALTISFHTGLWMLAVVTSLPVALGLLHQAG
uniref:Si:ch211-215c18.3 n=1 Tax=Sinocyclocheilus grahami TaxID=75366 RepID=A0A672KY15_SINGR